MPRRGRPRRSDSDTYYRSGYSEARTVWCETCGKTWRFACPECADHFAEYHHGAFDGHQVAVTPHTPRNDRDWQLGVPRSIQTLLGRY
jgi:hypothetical protein